MACLSPEVHFMTKERKSISFDVEEITNFLDGGFGNTSLRRKIVSQIQNDPVTGDLNLFYKNDDEKRANALKRALRLKKFDCDFSNDVVHRSIAIATSNSIGLHVHSGAFIPALTRLGSTEQVTKWIPLAEDFRIIGAYAQTELGHGTHLRGLETTANFIPETQEFEIHCPKLTSMKWWNGDLGKRANHAIVMANLIVNGKEYGMHPFMVQIRDLDTHKPLPGVTVGDIGRKFNGDYFDIGFLSLNHFRIPRKNMLTGIAEVDSAGHYHLKSHARLLYGGMLILRIELIDTQAVIPLQKACTIATRYSLIRRQGSIDPGGLEVSVLDYVTQQRKILPLIAQAYAYHFAARKIRMLCLDVMNEMAQGNFTNLSELHALSAGLKAYTTEKCLTGADICRRACGGHGYLEASGFPRIFLQQMSTVTLEGDNTVMHLQCARHLLKSVATILSGKTVENSARYFRDDLTKKCPAYSIESLQDCHILLECCEHRAHLKARTVYHKMKGLEKSGKSPTEASNFTSVELVEISKAHMDVYVLSTFIEAVENANVSKRNKRLLFKLSSLLGLHILNKDVGSLLMDGYVNSLQAANLIEAELDCLSYLRKDALGLVDAFDFTDKTLQSCLGAYDGNVYERLYENAKRSPRNRSEVHEGFYSLFKDSLQQGNMDIFRNDSKL